jgi:hypothetical protein
MAFLKSRHTNNPAFNLKDSPLLSGLALAALLVGSFSAAKAEDASATTKAAASSPASQPVMVSEDDQPAAPYSSSALPAAPAPGATAAVATAQTGPYVHTAPKADDSYQHFTFAAGAGFDVPAGATGKWQNIGWGLQLAGGHTINRWLSAQLQYDYDWAGMPGWEINEYNPRGDGGNYHLWSFSGNAVVNLHERGRTGLYLVGGPGFYRKMTQFTRTDCGFYCGDVILRQWSNNALGVDAGLGVTWRASRWNNMKYFAEARYVWVDNQYSNNNTATHGFPPANYATGYFPVTFGVRW